MKAETHNPKVALGQRLEISFWNFLIHLLKHPRRGWLLLGFVLVYLFVAGSLGLAAYQLYNQMNAGTPAQDQAHQPGLVRRVWSTDTGNPPGQSLLDGNEGQRNVLVVLVDQLEPPARLEAVWLAIYLPSLRRLTALSIYPALQPDRQEADSRLAAGFDLGEQGVLRPTFLEELYSRDLSWEGVVVIERAGWAYLAEGVASTVSESDQGLDSWPWPAQPAPTALLAQARFGQLLCQASAGLLDHLDPFVFVESLSTSVYTDIDPALVILEWNRLLNLGAGITCEFPILQDQEVAQ